MKPQKNQSLWFQPGSTAAGGPSVAARTTGVPSAARQGGASVASARYARLSDASPTLSRRDISICEKEGTFLPVYNIFFLNLLDMAWQAG